MSEHFDLAVIGAGSGGSGAALTAARSGISVLLVEQSECIGGTVTRAGVTTWEMGTGGTGLPFDIYRRMKQLPDAVGIYSCGRHFSWQDGWYWPHALEKVIFPGGENVIDPARRYHDTLRRHFSPGETRCEALCRERWHGVTLEPEAYIRTVADMLTETRHCDIRLNTTVADVRVADGRVLSAVLSDGEAVTADAWVDGTGDGVFALACSAQAYRGLDPRSRFREPGAPEEARLIVNGVSLIYRITPVEAEQIEPLLADIPANCWWAASYPPLCCNHFPNGDRACNMLPTMRGEEFIALGYKAAYMECRRRVYAHWHFLQAHFPEFRRFRLCWIAPMLGIRESNRLITDYILTENDILQGLPRQTAPDIITIADHALDRHGEGGGCPEVTAPYGIPYRCLIPKGFRNLLIACRAAGFSAIAATSARLTRTMMALGQAAGTAVAIGRELAVDLPDVPPDNLRDHLRAQHVQLEWPMLEELAEYLLDHE